MKKILSLVLSLIFVGCFALDCNTTTDEGIKEWKDKGDGYSLIGYGLDSVRNMNSENTTYEVFKKTFNDAIAKANETVKLTKYDSFKLRVVPQVILWSKRFNGFVKNVLNDTDYKDILYVKLSYTSKFPQLFTKQQIRTNCVDGCKTKRYNDCKKALLIYENNMGKFTDAEIKEDLKKMKRYIYPMIGTNDEWKQLAVKLQLTLKSVE